MTAKKTLLLFMFFVLTYSLWATMATIEIIHASQYKEEKITILSTSEPVLFSEKEIGNGTISNEGNLIITLNIDETALVFFYTGIYKVSLYVEPGKKYTLHLPERVDKTPAESLNPYFEYLEVSAGIISVSSVQTNTAIKEENELNYMINRFDQLYIPYRKDIINRMFFGLSKIEIDSVFSQFRDSLPDTSNPYFNTYFNYRYASIIDLLNKNNTGKTIEEYFQHTPLKLNNPAYLDLFNQCFNHYFFNNTLFSDRIQLLKSINEKKNLDFTLGLISLSNDTLRELVLLKQLYDEFYADNFSFETTTSMLKQIQEQSHFLLHQELAKVIFNNLHQLRPNTYAPTFILPDSAMNMNVFPDSGLYIYLNFMIPGNYTCIKHCRLLPGIAEAFRENMKIVTVFVGQDFNEMKVFMEANHISWDFLFIHGNTEVIKNYKISYYPSYYLIDRNKKILFNPAPSPEENIEKKVFELLRDRGELYKNKSSGGDFFKDVR